MQNLRWLVASLLYSIYCWKQYCWVDSTVCLQLFLHSTLSLISNFPSSSCVCCLFILYVPITINPCLVKFIISLSLERLCVIPCYTASPLVYSLHGHRPPAQNPQSSLWHVYSSNFLYVGINVVLYFHGSAAYRGTHDFSQSYMHIIWSMKTVFFVKKKKSAVKQH